MNIYWKQYSTRKELYDNIPPINSPIKNRRMGFTVYCFRRDDEVLSGLIIWPPSHGMRTNGGPCKIFFDQLTEDIDCEVEDLQTLMNDRESWKEKFVACQVYWIW